MGSENPLSNEIIGAAIEVHKQLGPGLLESAYEECLAHEFTLRQIPFERQKPLPVIYKGTSLSPVSKKETRGTTKAIALKKIKHCQTPNGCLT